MSCLQLQLPQRWCKVCQKTDNLSMCAACMCIFYCCREHQKQHRREHKNACKGVVAARAKLAEQKAKLEALPPSNLFEDPEAIGRFWQIPETRPYMSQLVDTAMAAVQVPTPLSVEAAVDYLMEALRLCPGDNLDVRSRVPNFQLRLGRDQECYDFIKYWRENQKGRKEGTFLDLKDQDIFESVELWRGGWPNLAHCAALTLIKIRLLVNLEALEEIKIKSPQANPNDLDLPEKLRLVRQKFISPWVFKRDDVMDREDPKPLLKEVKKQIKDAYDIVNEANKHFWPAMLEPDQRLMGPPLPYSSGDFFEAKLAWQYGYACWAETPGSLEALRLLRSAKWPQSKPLSQTVSILDFMHYGRFDTSS